MNNPTNARRILETYPNVIMGIKPMMPSKRWRNLEPVLNKKGEIYDDWAILFEDMSDRFVIGSDSKFMRKGFTTETYSQIIHLSRQLLGNLSAEAARRIAYSNAKEMFP